MLELVDYLAAAFVGGVGIGRVMRPKPPEPLRPVCSCGHGLGTHQQTGACNASVERSSKYDPYGGAVAWEHVPCACLRYDGPDPAIFGLTTDGTS